MKIYTKVGDGGNTFLFGGKKVAKNDPRVESYGDVDELNSFLGWAKTQIKAPEIVEKLETVQKELFVLGADLASPAGTKFSRKTPRIGKKHVARLEKEIDILEMALPPLRTFILPGGHPGGAALHLARSVCRRAERACIPLLKAGSVSLEAQIYLNRLSDYLFVLARAVNHQERWPETPWLPGNKS